MATADRTVAVARLAFGLAAWLFVAGVIVQVVLVGIDVFAEGDSTTHRDFAYVYGWLAPALVVLAAAANASRGTRAITVVLVVLFAIQTVLPAQRDSAPLLAALHTPNALAIFALAVTLANRTVPPGDLVAALRRRAQGGSGPPQV